MQQNLNIKPKLEKSQSIFLKTTEKKTHKTINSTKPRKIKPMHNQYHHLQYKKKYLYLQKRSGNGKWIVFPSLLEEEAIITEKGRE